MDRQIIIALINTLNKIPVCGKEAMGMMLGCIGTLEAELKKTEAANGEDRPADKRD